MDDAPMDDRDQFRVKSMVASKTQQGCVMVILRDTFVTLSSHDARAVGLALIESAQAADDDAVFLRMALSSGHSITDGAKLLQAFRITRNRMMEEDDGGTSETPEAAAP